MEKKILRAARHVPIGVIIPALFNDLSSPAMQHIIQELAEMSFVKRIYISLASSSEEEFQRATETVPKAASELIGGLKNIPRDDGD
jgi:glucosyl-3-phosphoglycerate synthase